MKKLDRETIERELFVNQILVGKCPKCGSVNTHDCEAQTPIIEKNRMIEGYTQYGSNCEVAKKLDDACIGHCDDCGYLWCLECGSELTLENPNCKCFEAQIERRPEATQRKEQSHD